jgi:hypothetical protein
MEGDRGQEREGEGNQSLEGEQELEYALERAREHIAE